MNIFHQLSKKMQVSFVLGIFAFLFGLAGIFTASMPSRAASSCDKVNIVYCGLTGTDVSGYISSVQQLNAANNNNGHNDIQQMFAWGGFSQAVINSMNTTNTKVGTLFRNGEIQVDGRTVGTGTIISARFGGSGFTQIKSGVWSRPTTTSMMNASEPVLVVFDANGKAIASMMLRCGNTLQFTPAPAPVLSCDGLVLSVGTQVVGSNVHGDFAYTAKNGAQLNSTTIDWGDGTVVNNAYDHTYTTAGTYTVKGTLHMSYPGTSNVDVSSSACAKQITITPKMCTIPGKEQYPVGAPECRTDVPGVTITKTVIDNTQKSATVKVNEQYSYTLVVKNTGNITLVNALVTDSPHAGVKLVSTDLGSISGNMLTATIPSLAPGQSFTIHLKAIVPTYVAGTIQNDACVNAKEVDTPSNPSNNDSCDKADVNVVKEVHPAVTITKTVNGKPTDQVVIGDTYSYEVTVKNTGDVALTNAAVTDQPEAGVVLLSQVDGLGTITNNQWTYTVPALALNESKTFKFTAKVTEYHASPLVNTACVNAPEVNPGTPDKTDACATATVTVKVQNPAITITKTINGAKNANLAVGTAFTYELTVKNTGEVALSNAVVSDQAPAGVSFTGADRGVIDSNGKWMFTIPSLAVGESTQFILNAKVTQYEASTIVNVACVNAPSINASEPTKDDACDSANLVTPTVPQVLTAVTPTVLPNTGSAGVVSLAAGIALLSSVFYSLVQSRKLGRQE